MTRMKKKIVVIDDQEDLLELTRRLLEARGYEVVTSTDSKNALGLIKKELPSLIIMDMLMPDKDGAEICNEVKSDTAVAHIPVILATGQMIGDAELLQEGLKPANDYLIKPFEIDDLLTKIKDLII